MLAECPWCGSRFEAAHHGRQRCPVCGAEIDLPKQEAPRPAPEEGQEAPAFHGPWEQTSTLPPGWEAANVEPEGGPLPPPPEAALPVPAPWERRGELGSWRAFADTWKGASLHPTRFFQALGPFPSVWPAFSFALLVLGLSSLGSALWGELLARSAGEEVAIFFPGLGPGAAGAGLLWLVPSLIFSAFGIWLFAAVVHLGGLVFGAASKGFVTTFRTVAFAQAPALLGILPGAGFFAFIWVYAVLIVGLRWTQETSAGRAALAVLFPFVVLGGLVILGAAATAVLFTLA